MNKKIIVSACLLGFKCRWDGEARPCQKLITLYKKGLVLPVCPEQLGGLSTPRVPAEIKNGNGKGVILGANKVINKNGEDVTRNFLNGAKKALKMAKDFGAKEFVGKSKSPSCGPNFTYEGTFTGKLTKGDGVTVALLRKSGFKIYDENKEI